MCWVVCTAPHRRSLYDFIKVPLPKAHHQLHHVGDKEDHRRRGERGRGGADAGEATVRGLRPAEREKERERVPLRRISSNVQRTKKERHHCVLPLPPRRSPPSPSSSSAALVMALLTSFATHGHAKTCRHTPHKRGDETKKGGREAATSLSSLLFSRVCQHTTAVHHLPSKQRATPPPSLLQLECTRVDVFCALRRSASAPLLPKSSSSEPEERGRTHADEVNPK